MCLHKDSMKTKLAADFCRISGGIIVATAVNRRKLTTFSQISQLQVGAFGTGCILVVTAFHIGFCLSRVCSFQPFLADGL